MKKSVELRERRAELIAKCRAILDLAQNEKREFKQEERETYRGMDTDIDKLTADIQIHEKQESREADLATHQGAKVPRESQTADAPPEPRKNHTATEEYRKAFLAYLRTGIVGQELRALQADLDTSGGFLVAPQEFVNQLLKFVDDQVFIRQYATKYRVTSAESLGVPVLDANPADADWTAEIATGTEDSSLKLAKRELRPHPLAKRIKVSNKLLRVSAVDPEALVRDRLAYKFAITLEKGYLSGSGANQPLGIFTASANGISTGRDVVTGAATDFTGDGLIDIKYALKPQYWRNARWGFHRDGVKRIRKLKASGTGQYLWEPGLATGAPDTILDLPYFVSEYIPNTFTTGLYVGILGDLSYYWICDALDFSVQRLVELYAETNQAGFIGRAESDGMPVLEEAFVRIKTS